MRIMLDTNILISAFLFKSKIMNNLIQELSIHHEIVICSYTIKELKLLFKEKFKVNLKELDYFLETFPFTLVYSPNNISNKLFNIRDEDDYIILHTAIVENIDIFITGDKDFDGINIKKPKIMNASTFLETYAKK